MGICAHGCLCVHMDGGVCMRTGEGVYTHACMCVCALGGCEYTWMCVSVHVCVHWGVCVHTWMCVCVCVCRGPGMGHS